MTLWMSNMGRIANDRSAIGTPPAESRLRFVIIDTLLERHLEESLTRALRRRGHCVRATGPVWHGWRLPSDPTDTSRIRDLVTGVIRDAPDAVLVMRPSALRPEEVARLAAAGIRTACWFADDPVFFKVQSVEVAPAYEITLHTSTVPVLEMYEHELGVLGWGFPFWADERDFPRVYRPESCDLDLTFIGNTHTRVKRWRYDRIAELNVRARIFGEVAEDPAGIHAGKAESPSDLAKAAARGRVGLNLSQRFKDYAGTRFDYPRMAEFGEFSLPSRVVQLAAIGVPVVSLVATSSGERDLVDLFPEATAVRSSGEVESFVRGHDIDQLRDLSNAVHARYRADFTADRRAEFLEALLTADRSSAFAPVRTRAVAFRR